MEASGKVQGLSAALDDVLVLKVADYQRDYSWGVQQIDELWVDIEVLLEVGTSAEHFMGTLILQKGGGPSDSGHYELVDGQQRLTTIFMFITVLLDHAKSHPNGSLQIQNRTFNVVQELENFILGKPGSEKSPVTTRLIPIAFLQKIFRTITNTNLTRTERLKAAPRTAQKGDKSGPITLPLRRAYNHIDMKITGHLDQYKKGSEARLQAINQIRKALVDQLKVLTLTTNDLTDSLDVFMTLNNRGTPLGVFDLFRGETLKIRIEGMPPLQRDDLFLESIEEWNIILENLGTYSADKYLRHFALTKNFDTDKLGQVIRGKPLTMKGLPKWTSDYLGLQTSPVQAAETLWGDAVQRSLDYGYMLRPDGDELSDYYLEALKLLGDSYRVLLLGIDFLNKDIWNRDKLEKLLLNTFKLFLKWSVSNGNAQELETKFQQLVGGYISKPDPDALIQALIFEAGFDVDLITKVESEIDSSVAKAIMIVIEAHLTPGSAKIELQKIQLEHIAPQKATKTWVHALGQNVDYSSTVQGLGNLVALDNKLNSKIKQWDFDKKCSWYKKSRLETVRDLVNIENWSALQIDARTKWASESISGILEGRSPHNFSESTS
jgi:hypothetical protein